MVSDQPAKDADMYRIAIPNEFTKAHNFGRADCILDSLADVNEGVLQQIVLHS